MLDGTHEARMRNDVVAAQTRNVTPTEGWLLEQMEEMEVIDAHENLPPERTLLTEHFDALLFFRQYTRLVMFSAGLSEKDFLRMHDPEVPLDERFAVLDRYREFIRASGAARAAYIALDRFYGETDVTRDNFDSITERMRELRRPGLYQRVLRETCRIRAVLQNAPEMDYNDPLLRPVPMVGVAGEWDGFDELVERIIRGELFGTIDDYLDERAQRLIRLQENGAVGFKHTVHSYCNPDRTAAQEVFRNLLRGDRGQFRPGLC